MTTDAVFSGSIPSLYDRYLGPLIFEPYAKDLANRVSALNAERVLETAAGTGIVTRALVGSLSPSVREGGPETKFKNINYLNRIRFLEMPGKLSNHHPDWTGLGAFWNLTESDLRRIRNEGTWPSNREDTEKLSINSWQFF